MSDRASELPETTAELVELQNYLNECRDVTMKSLREKIKTTAESVLFLMQHALLSCKRHSLALNMETVCLKRWHRPMKLHITRPQNKRRHINCHEHLKSHIWNIFSISVVDFPNLLTKSVIHLPI
jgi:hypothetical protein